MRVSFRRISTVCVRVSRATDEVIGKLTRKSRPYLVHLNIRQCQVYTAATFRNIAECKNLQDLNLSECRHVNVSVLLVCMSVVALLRAHRD